MNGIVVVGTVWKDEERGMISIFNKNKIDIEEGLSLCDWEGNKIDDIDLAKLLLDIIPK